LPAQRVVPEVARGEASQDLDGESAEARSGADAPDSARPDSARPVIEGPGSERRVAEGPGSDAELLRRHVAGDPEAFGELFLRHKDRLWAVAIRTLADPEDAADALQEAMISAFRRAESFRGEAAVTTWLHRIVVNACLDKIRRRSARPEVSGGEERLLDSIAANEVGADPATSSEVSMEVAAALRQLPHDQQVALVLVDMLDYPVAEAAEVLGVAQGTVKSRCARGRARLLPKLAHLRQSGGRAAGESTDPEAVDRSRAVGRNGGNRFGPESVLPAQEGSDEAH
jgi:RNA polymerase sigma-70 factor, ECF subfamily